MTLKEQFIDAFKSGKRFDIQNAEVIADEYAADFAAWCIEAVLNEEEPKGSSMKELQITYKKEKGLV